MTVKKIRKITGVVVSNSRYREGTLVIRVPYAFKHPVVHKQVVKHKKYQVQYDEKQEINLGTQVTFVACRPISKCKKWKIIEVSK